MPETFSQRLDQSVQIFSAGLHAARNRFWGHPRVAELFPHLLFRMYCEARATVHLLGTAIDRVASAPSADALSEPFLAYLRRLQKEETGHDDWLLQSLEALGFPRDEIRSQCPPHTTAAMVGSQYYWIHHHHPIALLGYIKVLENDPSPLETIQDFIRATGLPRKAFTYHLGHVDLESEHNRQLDELLDSLPLHPEHQALIGSNAARMLYYLGQSLDELVSLFEAGRAHPVRPSGSPSMF